MPVALESIVPSSGDATDRFLVRRGAGPLGHTVELLTPASVKALLSISAADVLGFNEAVDDRVAALLVAGSNVTLVYDDTLNTLTISATGGGGGTPGGSTGEVQYNNAGAFAGAADVEIEGGQLRLADVAAPAAPAASGLKLFSSPFGNGAHPAYRGPLDVSPLALQTAMSEGNICWWTPTTGTGISVFGWPAASPAGTATAAATANGSRRARMKRIEYLVTVAATTAIAIWRVNSAQYTINGGNSWEGGFRCTMHSGPSTGVTNASHRFFMGLRDTTAPTDVDPSTLTFMAGIGYDAADTQVQFMTNDNAGTATKVALGASFPKPNADRAFTYRLRMYAPPGTTRRLFYEVTYLETGAVATGSVTTNLPATTDFLAPVAYTSVGGVSAVTGLAVGSMFFQTEPY